ncbi:riboflavin biosynthesis protein RibD C-terminal domain protein [Aeromicrobium marinum DSM 15272]|uniref:Riboflavin biosynthesis protein RibD C-terminal domain protein n=1 Tax=Aeromicrobium marinum DSM 15272 TaxID=585531 RepID=E2SDC0_9ACTN|nr:dihydrofolate reductase family protein [Aeromicrobium marinum]EFQ82497.1 riboflavin biosynthesis protein RibD C-terminal domain protein [Aeromicrobium marinum DSM 15272]
MTSIRQVLPGSPGTPVGPAQLEDLYPWPVWPADLVWVRAMMVTTLDGAAAGPDGLSGSISSPEDRDVLVAVRRHADVVLIGAGTLRGERYSPMTARASDAQQRHEAGQRSAPTLAVLSGSLDLPWDLPVWAGSTHRPVVLSRDDADPGRIATARTHADLVLLPDLAPATIIGALVERGLRRIVCEGGPSLLRELMVAGLVDEADITVSPLFVGTSQSSVTETMAVPARFRLVHLLESDGTLMARYTKDLT